MTGSSFPRLARHFAIQAPARVSRNVADMENLMRKNILTIALVISLSVSALAAANSYRLLKTVVVAGAGGWDYLTVDDINRRLYISHAKQVAVLSPDSGA